MEAAVYAAWFKGSLTLLAFDKNLSPIKAKLVQVFQSTSVVPDAATMKDKLKFGPMRVKIDGREYDCIEFKRFESKEDLEKWRAETIAAKLAPPPKTV